MKGARKNAVRHVIKSTKYSTIIKAKSSSSMTQIYYVGPRYSAGRSSRLV
jgi:hypothetical protein